VNKIEQTIHQALTELDMAVRRTREPGAKVDLLPLFARIDELTRQLPRDSDSDLLHYLHRKSYEKARLWLEAQLAAESSRSRD
jgi:hypothetical protein